MEPSGAQFSYFIGLCICSQHVSSPLMEFERLKLIKEYKTDPPKTQASEVEGEEKQPSPQPEDGEELPVYIDYM